MTEQTHWGPDPGHGGLTQHKGSRQNCSGPDCGSEDGSHFWQAVQRLDASDYQWQESGFDGGLREAMVAQVHSNLAVVHELRRLNEGRDQWYREVLEVLTQAKDVPAKQQCWKTKRGPQPVVGEAFIYRCVLELGHDGKCTDGERMEWT